MTGFSFMAAAVPVYGENAPKADIARGMDVLDAAFLIAQETPGGVAALAARMGVSANTLQHKLNPNNNTHHLTLKEAVALQVVSGLPYVLYAMAAALDHVCLRARALMWLKAMPGRLFALCSRPWGTSPLQLQMRCALSRVW